MSDYNDETQAAIVDSKLIMDQIISADLYGRVLDGTGFPREDVKEIWDTLEDLIYTDKMDYDLVTVTVDEYEVRDFDGIDAALRAVRSRLDGIDDPWFWTEEEDRMNGAMELLDELLDDDEDM